MEVSVAGEMDRANLEEFRGQLRRLYYTRCGEMERIVLPFNLEKAPRSFSTEAMAKATSQTLAIGM